MVILQPSAHAHKIKCFASVEEGRIVGYSWMGGGVRPEGVPYRVLDPEGRVVAEGLTSEGGTFQFDPAGHFDHTIVVEAGEGHIGRFTVEAEEWAPAPASAKTAVSPRETESATARSSEALGDAARMHLLEKELEGCREQIAFCRALAGVGIIFGLAGTAFYLTARKQFGVSA